MRKIQNLIGLKFGRLEVKSFSHVNDHGNTYWFCLCRCGSIKTIGRNELVTKKTRSCGCLAQENRETIHLKHGHALSYKKSPTYSSWGRMKKRCLNSKSDKFKYYGGRGITICKSWLKFENFLKDMGDRPIGKTLDRIDNNGNYCKKNCKWSTKLEQMRNRRTTPMIKFNGRTKALAEWAQDFNLDYSLVWNRLNKLNWPIKKALTLKPKLGRNQYGN